MRTKNAGLTFSRPSFAPSRQDSAARSFSSWKSACLLIFLAAFLVVARATAEELNAAALRMKSAIEFLAADEREGRGIGTQGLDQSADYIAEQFTNIGLKTKLYDGTPFQKFEITTGAELGEDNRAALVGPDGQQIELKLGKDFTPLAIGGSGEFDLPLVFAGYGITGIAENYDDYANVEVADKAVVVLRHEPQQDNPHSVFNGTAHSQYAPFSRKVANASEHGVAAVVFVTGEHEILRKVGRRLPRYQSALKELNEEVESFIGQDSPSLDEVRRHLDQMAKLDGQRHEEKTRLRAELDPVLRFNAAGQASDGRRFPVLHMRRAVIDRVLQAALGKDLAKLEQEIDQGPTPHSQAISGWRLVGRANILRKPVEIKNVIGVLEGEGPLADETVMIGAHYDHLGMGGPGSLAPGVTAVHNGADDNASGTATLIEVARRLANRKSKLRRRVVFIAFTAEERGLIGSAHYVRDPLVPLEDTVAMLNMDMVGRLRDSKLIIYGTRTATEFDSLIDQVNQKDGFAITKRPSGFGPSDQATFYGKKIPVLHFFTGTHADYHRPTDDVEKINFAGMSRVADMVTEIAVDLANADRRPTYQATGRPKQLSSGDRPYFGSIPDFSQQVEGYALGGVAKGGPAEKAGLQGGDVIVHFGESKIANLEDFDSALRKFKGGDKVKVVVLRDDKKLTFEVTLDPPR